MKFNLLSNNKLIVNIGYIFGFAMIWVDIILHFLNIALGSFWWTTCFGGIIILWSIFSNYYIVVEKNINLNPSRMVGNLSFVILSVLWGILFLWIYLS